MKENRILSNLGKVLLTFLIALSSVGMPTAVSADSSGPYAYAKSEQVKLINETGLQDSELYNIDIYEVTGNMEIVKTSLDELKAGNGEYVLRLRDHDPSNSIYNKSNEYDYIKARKPSKAIYAFRVDPLMKYQPCPDVHMYIEQLGLNYIKTVGSNGGPATPGNMFGPKGPDREGRTTNVHTYLMMDPRIDLKTVNLDVELRVVYDTDTAGKERFANEEFQGLKDNLELYIHYLKDGEVIREVVPTTDYTVEFTQAKGHDDFMKASYNISNKAKYGDGAVVAYEPVLTFEDKKFYSQRESRMKVSPSNVEMKASYNASGDHDWMRESTLEDYVVGDTPIQDYIDENKLEIKDPEGASCGVHGETNINGTVTPGPGWSLDLVIPGNPPENLRTLKKLAVGDTEGSMKYTYDSSVSKPPVRPENAKMEYTFGLSIGYVDVMNKLSSSMQSWEKVDDLLSAWESNFYVYNDRTIQYIKEGVLGKMESQGYWGTAEFTDTVLNDEMYAIVKNDAGELVIVESNDEGVVEFDKDLYPDKNLFIEDTLHVFNIENKEFKVDKIWDGKVLNSAEFILKADGEEVERIVLNEDNNWEASFGHHPIYKLDESSLTEEALINNEVKFDKINYTVEEVEIDGYESTVVDNGDGSFTVTNEEIIPQTPLVPATTSVSVEKEWKLYQKESQPVTVNLLADGKKVDSVVLSNDNDWSHTFTKLKVVNDVKDEKAIVYTIEEVEVDGFKSNVKGNQKDGFVITNEEIIEWKPLVPAKTSVSVSKRWDLFEKGMEPVTVNLLADGIQVDSVILSDDNEWSHTFTDLKVVNDVKDEKAIEYTVEEVEIDGFKSTITGNQKDGFIITNTEIVPQTPLVPATTSVSVAKQWELFQKDKQPVTVNLLADGKQVDSVELSDNNDWSHTFTDLKVVNDVKDEKAIVYTVEEVAIDGFESIIEGNQKDGFIITNKEVIPQTPLVPATTEVKVEKKWRLFAKESQPVTVNLLADGMKVDSIELSAKNDWEHTFTDLKVVNDVKDEKAIVYTVEEVKIDGFESIIEGNQKDGFVITNKEIIPQTPLEPATTSVSVEKQWELFKKDKMPVTVNLLADGKVVDSVELSDNNDWKHTFTDLKVVNDVKDEKAIVYTVEEVAIDGFESIIEGSQKDGFVITNKEMIPQTPLEPATTKVKVEKKWRLFAKESQPVTVNLLADGTKVDSVELSAKNDWTHTFTDLKVVNDVKDEKAIVYTVEEIEVDGFESIIEGNQKDGFVIMNKEIIPQKPLIPAKTSVSVAKQWELFQKDKMPVTVNLLADGEVVDSVELSDNNDWSHTFTDLKVVNDVKDEKAIVYTVEEVEIDGFESVIEGNQNDGFMITNKEIIPQIPLVPAKTSITVNKEWKLYKSDKQPVVVELLADGEVIDEITLSNDNNWTHTFTDLKVVNDVTDESAIEYSVSEKTIEGFKSEVTREGNVFTIINTEIVPQTPLVPATTSVSVMKQWELMRLSKQPVVVELLANGEVIDEVTLSDDNNWAHTFTDLKVVNDVKDEKAIEYTVREITPEGFLSIIEEIDGVIVITNSETPVPNITADKTVDKAEIKPGEVVEYTITVTNDGTGNKFVTVKDPMDDLIDYITFVDEYVMVGDIPYTFSELRNGIEFEIGVGQTVDITFKVKFNEDAEGEFLNVAFVDELEPEAPVTVTPEEPNCDEPQDPNNPDPNCPIIPEEPNCDEPQDPNNPDPNCPIIPEEPNCDEPQDPNNPDPNCPIIPEEPNCDEPQDPNNPDPNCPIIPEEPQVDVPRQPGRPVDTGEFRRPPFVSFALIGMSALYVLKKRKQ